ncbi:unnamed protein product [Prorocentrum cordatum]|uniref:Subtilisin n=1 Tax=Prorocentrum cordatum TaxID=2364126 RepID=A0ABN9XDL6_9DINO|nr:unnamed protein product [Polarella glacialis]
MTQKAPARACLLIPLLAHGVFGTTAAAEVDLQEDTVLLQLGTDAASFDLARVSSLKGVSTVTSTVLPVNTSQQTGRRQVEAADHMVKGAFWNQVGQDIDGEASGDRSGEVVSLSSRRQPRGHWSFLQRRCWVGFWSRSRLRVFANAGTYAGAFASADGRTIGFANASTDARADVGVCHV